MPDQRDADLTDTKICLTPIPSADAFRLAVSDVACVRGEARVFSNIHMDITSRSAYEIRGVNGSGKTSLLRLIAGLNQPDQGSCKWHDDEAAADAPDRCLYIGHLDGLKPSLSVLENLKFWADFLFPNRKCDPKDPLPCDPFSISQFLESPVRTLSAGQKRRVSLTRLVLSPAWLWLLDEPTTSLDTTTQKTLWQVIADHRARGGAVLVSTHGDCDLPQSQGVDLSVRQKP